MATQFQYVTNTGELKTFEAADSTSALGMLSGFSDAAKSSGVMEVKPQQVTTPTITSSASPVLDKNKQDAVQNAGNNLTGGTTPTQPTTQDQILQYLMQQAQSGNKESQQLLARQSERLMDAQKLSYDAALASKNFQYKQLHDRLTQGFERNMQVAKSTAVSLNPYSQATQATTAQKFGERIEADYQQAAADLQFQADLAQQQLEAGNYKAYVDMQNALESGINQLERSAQQSMMDLYKMAEQSRQFEEQMAFSQQSLQSQERRAAADDFRLGLTQINYTPESIQAMIESGDIYKDPTFLSGVQAHGIEAIPGIISAMKQGSLAQQKQLDLQWYREQQLALSNARLINAQNNMTRFQSIQAAQQSAMVAAQGSGYDPDDIRYSITAAMGSSLGAQPTQADRDYYRDVQSLTANAERFRTELNKLSNNTQARNAISTWMNNPLDDEAQTFMATQMPATYRIASIAFGQSGRGLSDKDFEIVSRAIGTGAQSNAAREQIFAGWLQDAQVGMASKLKADAFGGINVAPYAADVENATKKINTLIGTTKSSGGTYKGYTLPN